MRLEGILSEMRASVPKSKSCVTAERVAHLAYLHQVLKSHLAQGFQDPRKESTAEEMLKENVPVERLCPDRRQKARAASEPPGDGNEPSDYCPGASVDYDADVCGAKPEDDLFCPGNVATPVRDEVLRDFLHLHDTAGGVAGVAATADRLRKTHAAALIVEDAGDVPDSRKFEHRMACWEYHPGLCAARDSLVYDDALLLARSLERCLGKHMLYRWFKVSTGSGDCRYYYLARCRSRRLHMQATHCVIACERNVSDLHTGITVAWKERSPRNPFFQTLWTMAAVLLRLKWSDVTVHRME